MLWGENILEKQVKWQMAKVKIQMENGKSKLENGRLAQTSDVCVFCHLNFEILAKRIERQRSCFSGGHHSATENSSLFSDRSMRTRQTRIRSPRRNWRFECWPMMARKRSR